MKPPSLAVFSYTPKNILVDFFRYAYNIYIHITFYGFFMKVTNQNSKNNSTVETASILSKWLSASESYSLKEPKKVTTKH